MFGKAQEARTTCLVDYKRGRNYRLSGSEDLVIGLFISGCSIRMIASELCIPKSSVHRFIKHLNVDKNRRFL